MSHATEHLSAPAAEPAAEPDAVSAGSVEAYHEVVALYHEWCAARAFNFRSRLCQLLREDLATNGTYADSALLDRVDAAIARAQAKALTRQPYEKQRAYAERQRRMLDAYGLSPPVTEDSHDE